LYAAFYFLIFVLIYYRYDVRTEYKRFEYLKKSKFFIRPESFFIGDLYDDRKDGQKTTLTIKKCKSQIVSMREILKSLLEIPNFYKKVLNIINTDSSSLYTNKVYANLCHHLEINTRKLW